ncbi:MAG: xanthine dehydrogenase family protein subunit M [Chloroflexi bacterium]|nr:xanthine dehydrogenase family protein subunit M [Chloroflexota bacterium]
MFPAAFDYYAPTSLQEAIGLLGDGRKVLAGGHSLLPLMKFRLAEPSALVDIGRVPGLDGMRAEGSEVVIGARATHASIERSSLLAEACPLLVQTAQRIGDIQVRTRGTIGGSLAHADPGADLPAAVLALNATLTAQGPSGSRSIPAREFFTGLMSTALADNEILTEVRVPKTAARTGTAYQKFPNPASRYAIVGVAAVLHFDGAGAIERAALGVTGLSGVPFRATAAEDALRGERPTSDSIAAAAKLVGQGQDPLRDIHASPGYRVHLAEVLTRRALQEAARQAGA